MLVLDFRRWRLAGVGGSTTVDGGLEIFSSPQPTFYAASVAPHELKQGAGGISGVCRYLGLDPTPTTIRR